MILRLGKMIAIVCAVFTTYATSLPVQQLLQPKSTATIIRQSHRNTLTLSNHNRTSSHEAIPQAQPLISTRNVNNKVEIKVDDVTPVTKTITGAVSYSLIIQHDASLQPRAGATPVPAVTPSPERLLEELMSYSSDVVHKANNKTENGMYKLGYSVDDGKSRRFRFEEKNAEGTIEGEFGFHRNNGPIRGVQYTAEPGVHPKVLYEALVKFFSL